MTIKKMGLKKMTLNYDQHQLTGLELMQGDTLTRGYSILVTDADGRVIKASSDYELRMYCVNMAYPEQTYYRVAEINGDRYDVIVPTSALTQKGRVKIQVGLYESDDTAIYSHVWEGNVGESLPQGGATEGSDLVVDFTKLTIAIEKVDVLEGKYEESLAEQRLIKEDVDTKHTEVTTMHTELKTTLDKELERQESETARATAEEERDTAESERDTAETARKEAETDRQGKESARQSVEAGRVSAENTRVENETERVENETDRKAAETERVTAESDRASAETDRASAESVRVANEETRVSIQAQRDTTWEAWQDLIEDGILPPATPTVAGAVKIDTEGADTAASVDTLNTELAKKVDIVAGMGLSQNSYTTIEKQKLSGVESGANKYVHPETHSLDMIEETAAKKIMTSDERIKLEGIEEDANNYTHPASHDASMITESATRRFVSDTEKTTWNAKIGSHGSITIEQIAVISAGGSTDGIPNNTLILELE